MSIEWYWCATPDIAGAQHSLWETLRIVAEPAGATAFAALLLRAYVPEPGEHVGVVIGSANSVPAPFRSWHSPGARHQDNAATAARPLSCCFRKQGCQSSCWKRTEMTMKETDLRQRTDLR